MTDREIILSVLKDNFPKSASNYEQLIYEMCEHLAKEVFEESIEDVYNYYAFEKIGQLVTGPVEEVIDDIKNNRIGNESFYCRKKKKVDSEFSIERKSGIFKCKDPGCRARYTKETIMRSEQRRSGDEGMSLIVTCRVCQKEYTL